MGIRITNNFTLEELCASSTAKDKGITNQPKDTQVVVNLTHLCVRVLQPLRDAMGESIKIGSGYRCAALNKAVGGVSNSQHMAGEAVDLCIYGDLKKGWKWFEYIRDHLPFDQLIWEHNAKGSYWVHVSHKITGNRKKVITNLLKK